MQGRSRWARFRVGIDKAMPSNSNHGFMASIRVQILEVPPSPNYDLY